MGAEERMTLAEAKATGKIDQFIAQNEGVSGDMKVFNQTVEAMAGKSPPTRQTSPQDGGGD